MAAPDHRNLPHSRGVIGAACGAVLFFPGTSGRFAPLGNAGVLGFAQNDEQSNGNNSNGKTAATAHGINSAFGGSQ